MSRTAKCSVVGCPGVATIETDGRGGTVSRCPCCEKRETWKLEHIPDIVRGPCEICGGQITAKRHGARTKYCAPCKALVVRKQRADELARKKKSALKVAS